MRTPHFVCLAFLALSTVVGPRAAAEITKSESFETSAKTSLKIPEPQGAHVFVTIGKEVKDDATPAIFALPDADAYVNVKIVMSDGETWTGKVEIKAKHQTVLRFTQTKKGAAAPSATPAARSTGSLVNTTDKCDWPENIKFVINRDGNKVFTSGMVFPGKEISIPLENGNYFIQMLDTSSTPLGSRTLTVSRDGWKFTSGCVKKD
ncbi:Hypothetical protein A7982_06994 [Minicystis rosea]|nr:Hypothetical protein A7982_06994 [Minicystis rosea]